VVERFKYKIEPMDLENMRQNGVRSLDIQCLKCLHRVIPNVDHLPGDLTVPFFGPRMACTKCGTIGRRRQAELAGKEPLTNGRRVMGRGDCR
jgi:hypothetical protein